MHFLLLVFFSAVITLEIIAFPTIQRKETPQSKRLAWLIIAASTLQKPPYHHRQSPVKKQRRISVSKRLYGKKKKKSVTPTVKARKVILPSAIRSIETLYDSLLVPGIIYRKLGVVLADSSRAVVHAVTCVIRHARYAVDIVQAHDQLGKLEALPSLVRRLDSAHNKDVLVAVNGSYWRAGTHVPLGITVSNGEIVAQHTVPWYTWWLDRRYRSWVDSSKLVVSIRLSNGTTFPIEAINRSSKNGLTLFNRFAGDSIPYRFYVDTTDMFSAQLAVVDDTLKERFSLDSAAEIYRCTYSEWSLQQHQGKLLVRYLRSPSINQPIPCIILAKLDSGRVDIPLRGCVISYPSGHVLSSSVNVGDTLYLFARLPQHDSLEFHFGITGTPLLVRDGKIVPSLVDTTRRKSAFVEQRVARTAIGTDIIQSVLYLVVVEAFPGKSVGMTLRELAYFMKRFGAYHALNLDGGSSSTMMVGKHCVAPSIESLRRPVANAIVIWQRRTSSR